MTASAQESGSGRPLGRPLERLRLRDGLSQHRAHLRQRLDRNDLRPRRHEQARQLPGPGGDGDDDPTAAEPEPLCQPRHRVRRVLRP